ncbi:hypothetical protein EGW08_001828, partial [Elysia chlorotica]
LAHRSILLQTHLSHSSFQLASGNFSLIGRMRSLRISAAEMAAWQSRTTVTCMATSLAMLPPVTRLLGEMIPWFGLTLTLSRGTPRIWATPWAT